MYIKDELLVYIETIETDILLNSVEVKTIELLDTERDAIIKARIGQGGFMQKLIIKYGKCRVCGMDDEKLLIASHIKPWAISNDKEKLDDNNGLLLCPNHDALFDKMPRTLVTSVMS